MICCPTCGSRCWKGEDELRRWRSLALHLLASKGEQGHLIVGTGPTSSVAWASERVRVRFEADADSLAIRWDSPSLTGARVPSSSEGGRTP